MLPLIIDKAAFDKLPKDVQALYIEKDGKYALEVEGLEDTSGLKSALEKERTAAKLANKLLKELREEFDGIDPAQVRELLSKFENDDEAKLIKAGKIDEVVTKRTEKLRADLQKQIVAAESKVKAAEERGKKWSTRVLDNEIRAAAAKHGIHAQAIDDALFRGRTMFTLSDEGEAVQLDANGSMVMGKDGKKPFSPAEWIEGMRESAPHWFPANGSGGGAHGSGKDTQGKRTVKRSEFEAMDPLAKASTARDKNVVLVD